MNARLSTQMTLLGICAMAFYGVMLGTGVFSTDLMPQFIISAVIFLSSGKIMRKAAQRMVRDEAILESLGVIPSNRSVQTIQYELRFFRWLISSHRSWIYQPGG